MSEEKMIKFLELKIPPLFLLISLGFIAWMLPRHYVLESSYFLALSLFLFIAGGLVIIMAIIKFRIGKTTVDPRDPQRSKKLVVKGIYRFTRNPMYLGFLFWLVSFICFLGNVASLLTVPFFISYMNYFQIIPEERILLKKFGKEYSRYKHNVRRWI